jgi:hypothetical protein
MYPHAAGCLTKCLWQCVNVHVAAFQSGCVSPCMWLWSVEFVLHSGLLYTVELGYELWASEQSFVILYGPMSRF